MNIKPVLFTEPKKRSWWYRLKLWWAEERFSVRVRHLLRLPGPKDLGRADSNDFLPSNFWSDVEEGEYTWESWEKEVKEKYPVRHFLSEVAAVWLSRKWTRMTDAIYWVKCHTLPSYRFHMLDLRHPYPGSNYSYGWVDRCEVVLWAPFIALRDYIEKEEPANISDHYSAEEIESDPFLQEQKRQHDEALFLYNWWVKGRQEEGDEESRLFQASRELDKDSEEYATARQAWVDYRGWRDRREDEMLERLIKIRRTLWT